MFNQMWPQQPLTLASLANPAQPYGQKTAPNIQGYLPYRPEMLAAGPEQLPPYAAPQAPPNAGSQPLPYMTPGQPPQSPTGFPPITRPTLPSMPEAYTGLAAGPEEKPPMPLGRDPRDVPIGGQHPPRVPTVPDIGSWMDWLHGRAKAPEGLPFTLGAEEGGFLDWFHGRGGKNTYRDEPPTAENGWGLTPGREGSDFQDPKTYPTPEPEDVYEDSPGGSGGGGGASRVAIPTYNPGSSMKPDWGPMPDAPVYQTPDYSEANRYYEEGKPKPYEEDIWDKRMAGIAGMLSGFDAHGSLGEILGRMAGPGMGAYYQASENEEEQQRQAEEDLAQWNLGRGEMASEQAGVTAGVANQNVQAKYQNVLDKRAALIEESQWAREEDQWKYKVEIDRANLELDMLAEEREAAYDAWQVSTGGGSGGAGKAEDALHEAFDRGFVPGSGVDLAQWKQDTTAEIEAKVRQKAEEGDEYSARILSDPTGKRLDNYINESLWSQFRAQYGR